MVITYRRTGGFFTLVAVAAAGTLLLVSAAVAAMTVIGGAVLTRRWSRRAVPPVTPWPHRTIDATATDATGSSDTRGLCRVRADTR